MSKKLGQNQTRRNIIKSAAGLAVTAGFTSAGVSAKQEKTGIVNAGIKNEFVSLMKSGERKKAFDLLDAHDVEYSVTTQSPPSDGVSTQDYFDKSDSSASFFTGVWNENKNEYAIGLSWDLKNTKGDVDGPAPVDVGILGYEQDVFGYKDDSIIYSGTLKDPNTSNSVSGVTDLKSEPNAANIDAPNNASVVTFNDKRNQGDVDGDGVSEWYPVGTGYAQMVLIKQDTRTVGNVSGLYKHTWSYGNIADWNILQNVAVPVIGTGISVSLPVGADSWTIPGNRQRDDTL
ncbi:hypothetical protein [Haladaptatus paucihalophilus]|uniref:Uncharacterized protein n=1 Tax=Haladaptatus paucihalophilus DX253 TaxID=797209 RepID=A0A1M6W4P9_HALPU|nr:hypothetical protein [Haladaptatus paucihalophilus]SHK88693.1 hypothetical protein SAMN05444342_2513 [Haladaptatus paucihalophilus DX253]